MKIGDVFPSKYLKASDLGEKNWTMTISHVTMEKIGQGEDADTKPIVYFKGAQKGLVCNKTNANQIAKLTGSDDTEEWAGKQITIYATEVQFQADMVPAIRVRSKNPTVAPAAAKIAAKAVPAEDDLTPPEGMDGIGEEEVPF